MTPAEPAAWWRRLPLWPTLVVLLACAAMVALGVWQLQRKAEKEALIALYRANSANGEAVKFPVLPPVPESLYFRKSSLVCLEPVRWIQRGGTDRSGVPGIRMIADCRYGAEGPGVLIDIGVADDFHPPDWPGGSVPGVIVPGPEQPSMIERLTGKAVPARAMLVSDFAAPGLRPTALPTPAGIPDNHFAYAVQWFIFALIALAIYVIALRRRLRR